MGKKLQVISLALAIAALIAVVIFVIKSPQTNLIGGVSPEKLIEFRNTKLIGWSNGNKLWEISAEAVWSTKNQVTTTFEKVRDGVLYNDKGKLIMRGLSAGSIKYSRWSGDIEALGSLATVDIANLSTKEAKYNKPRFMFIRMDHAYYSQSSQTMKAEGHIVISEKNMRITGNKMETHGTSKIARFYNGVRITRDGAMILAKELLADFKADIFTFIGEVEIVQREKAAVGEKATLMNKEGKIVLEGKVKFLVDKGASILDDDTARNLKNPKAKELLGDKTILSCDKLTIFSESKDAEAQGNVLITQANRKAKSDRASYLSQEEKIIMTGNVFIEKEKQWLKTNKVVVLVSGEAFEAEGQVETEFKIER